MYRFLSCLRSKDFTFDTYDISDIHLLEILIRFYTDLISCYIGLNSTLKVLYVTERCFTHHTFEH